MKEPTYLGDGVYAQETSYEDILLTTGSHREDEADNKIILEPQIVQRLVAWLNKKH